MIHTRFRSAVAAVCLAAALVLPAFAQAQSRTAAPATTPAATPPVESSAVQTGMGLNQNARETRGQFYKILEQYPPALGRVLRLDPTLMTNREYLSSYPNVSRFIAQYPDVPRNPAFYLERYDPDYSFREPPDARRQALNMWGDVLGFIGAFLVFCVVTYALFAIVKYVVEYRRWHRISKTNSEVHNKILDRFGSNEELLAYIDSPAGRRFLEATPIAQNAVPSPMGAPYGRILMSIQLGILLTALAIAMMFVSRRALEEIQQLFVGIGIVALGLGIGCIVSAAASYVLSRKLGLLPAAPAARPSQSV